LNKFRKAISAGLTATMLATLLTAVVAGPAAAAVTATSAGTFAPGTTSTGTVTFTFTERADPNDIAAAGSLTVTINDADGGDVTFSGTPSTAGSTGSLGASATAAGNVLTVSWSNHDPLNSETLIVSGLKIAAAATATPGPISATLGGTFAPFFSVSATSTATASGVIQDTNTLTAGADSADILLTSVCPFAANADDVVNSNATFSDVADARGVTAATFPLVGGVQTVTFAAGAATHADGITVTQTVSLADCQTTLALAVLATPVGTIAAALAYTSPQGNLGVFPGENNQLAGNLQFVEPAAGFLSDGTTVTLTIKTAGVTFSSPSTATVTAGDLVLTPASPSALTLSADRTAATFKVSTASTAASTIVVSGIRYDVASTVASGTLVTVEATVSGGKLVNPTTRTNAQVGRIFNASAPTPNVNIGQNGQAAGLITITEVTAGAFTDGTGPNNVFEVCTDGTFSFTSPGPSAFVTGGVAAGNLILREGAAASPDNIVPGTPDPANPGCFYWTVWTKSTTASTVVIGSSATVGPLVNVAFGSNPGPLNANLSSGTLGALILQVSLPIANRVFATQVQVTAVSQPIIAPGATHALAGDIMIQETGNGQLKLNERICVEVVPNQNTGTLTDVYLTSVATNDVPVATASNGVVIGAVTFSTQTCSGALGSSGNLFDSFSFVVGQQSTTGNGKIVISNIHYNAVNDAATGPVQVNVWGLNAANIDFQRVISNAVVGNPVAGTAATRLGVTQVGAFTISTKIAKVGKYVTYRFDFGVGAAGKAVQVWGATKTGNDWSAFTVVTTRTANASGVVYYYIRQNSATWKSYRGYYVAGGAWTPARQARWIP
jgi:hypothetical protein